MRTRLALSLLGSIGFLGLIVGSGGDGDGPSSPEGAGGSEVKVTEPGGDAEPVKMECTEDVTGKVGSMIETAVKAHNDKTDVQKEAHEAELKKAWQEAGYCATISGEVSDVKLDASFVMHCDAPDGMDGMISLKDVDGVQFRSTNVFLPADRIKSDFAELNKGAKVEMEVYIYDLELLLNGAACGVLK